MCQYYAHVHRCKHVSYHFARFCKTGGLIQTPCPGRRQIWATLALDEACDEVLPTVVTTTPGDPGEELPFTGVDTGIVAAIAALMLGVGATLLGVTRRLGDESGS